MRRNDRAVTEPSEIVQIMSRCEVLHLAIAAEPAPYLLPVSFGMEPDGMTLYIHGANSGQKYDLIGQNNRVGFELDCTHGLVLDEPSHNCTVNYESVMGWGIVTEITDTEQKLHALNCIMAHYHAEDFAYDASVANRTRILCVKIQERTAKRRKKHTALKVYGTSICPDTVRCCEELTKAGVSYEYLDFSEKTANLKAFLQIRDGNPLFDSARAEGKIGIPCIQRPDGSITFSWEEFL